MRDRQTQPFMDLRTYLIAASADGRSQVKEEILHWGTHLVPHSGHPLFEDTIHRAPPARVKECRALPHRIHEKDRHTIRHRHSHERPWNGCDMAIRILPQGETSIFLRVEENGPAMNLAGMSHPWETQPTGQILPDLPRSRWADLPEKGKIPGTVLRYPAGGALGQPGKAALPFGVDPPEKGRGRRGFGPRFPHWTPWNLRHGSDQGNSRRVGLHGFPYPSSGPRIRISSPPHIRSPEPWGGSGVLR
jgi:hypothetical protein